MPEILRQMFASVTLTIPQHRETLNRERSQAYMICRSMDEFEWEAVKADQSSLPNFADREAATADCSAGVMHDCAQ